MEVSYDEHTDRFGIYNTNEAERSLREDSMPMEALEESEIGINVFNHLAANLMALSIGVDPNPIGSPAPPPLSRESSVATAMSIESPSIAASIMGVLPIFENPNPNLTLEEVNAKVDSLVLELMQREELRAIVVPERDVIHQHYVFAVGISTRDGSVTPTTPAVIQAMVSAVPLLEKTDPSLYALLDTPGQQIAGVLCGPRAGPAGVCLSLSAQVKTSMYMSQIVSAIQNVPGVYIDPENPPNPCTLTFFGDTSFTPKQKPNLTKLFIEELTPVVEVLKTIGMGMTGYMPILISRVLGIGHFIRIILFPVGQYEGKNYYVNELNYGVMFVDPANDERKQNLKDFINNPIGEQLNSISAFRWPTSFPKHIKCGKRLKNPTPTEVGIQIDLYTPGETHGGGSLSKKGTMKKHKKPKGSGNRSKNKRNKSARHMKKRVKHLLKAAKKRGQSGKRSKSSKNAKRKSRTKKDNTIKRLKIKGLGRTRKLDKHGRK